MPWLGEDVDGLARGGAADAFPVFGCVVELAFVDAFWAATVVCQAGGSNRHLVSPRKPGAAPSVQ